MSEERRDGSAGASPTCSASEFDVMNDFNEQMIRAEARQGKHDEKRLAIVASFRTKKYMAQVRELMEEIGCHSLAFTRNTGRAKKQKCEESPAIKWEWVDQYENGGYTGDSFAGFLYIEIKPNRYLRMHYAM